MNPNITPKKGAQNTHGTWVDLRTRETGEATIEER